MNVDEALAEIFADRDSDLSDESDHESEDVWELSGNRRKKAYSISR